MYKHGFPSYSLSVQWIWSCIDTYFLNIFQSSFFALVGHHHNFWKTHFSYLIQFSTDFAQIKLEMCTIKQLRTFYIIVFCES